MQRIKWQVDTSSLPNCQYSRNKSNAALSKHGYQPFRPDTMFYQRVSKHIGTFVELLIAHLLLAVAQGNSIRYTCYLGLQKLRQAQLPRQSLPGIISAM